MVTPTTLLDKIWSSHAILVRPDGATLLHIDRHLVHDGSGNAFRMLKEKGWRCGGPTALSRRRTITSRRSTMISLRSMNRTAEGLSKTWKQMQRPQG